MKTHITTPEESAMDMDMIFTDLEIDLLEMNDDELHSFANAAAALAEGLLPDEYRHATSRDPRIELPTAA